MARTSSLARLRALMKQFWERALGAFKAEVERGSKR
jgi:hypothetical protein